METSREDKSSLGRSQGENRNLQVRLSSLHTRGVEGLGVGWGGREGQILGIFSTPPPPSGPAGAQAEWAGLGRGTHTCDPFVPFLGSRKARHER